MNKSLLILAVIAFSNANAQYKMTEKDIAKHQKNIAKSKEKNDIIWDYDTVYNSGVPYCIIYEVEKGALRHNDLSIRSLSGVELIYVKYGTYTDYTSPRQPNTSAPVYGYYSYMFSDTKKTGEVLTGTRVFKEVGRAHLIADGGMSIDPAGEEKFIAQNPVRYSLMPTSPPPPVVAQAPNYSIIPRNHNGGIGILLGSISQDGVNIGSVQNMDATNNGVSVKTMNFFLPNGTKVAFAVNQGTNSHGWSITTLRDNNHGAVSSSNGQDNMDVVKFLIAGGYL